MWAFLELKKGVFPTRQTLEAGISLQYNKNAAEAAFLLRINSFDHVFVFFHDHFSFQA
jgi:hypothetical protein